MAEKEQQFRIDITEKAAAHQMEMERARLLAEIKDTSRGQLFGTVIAGGAIVSAVVTVALGGPPLVACAFLSVPVLGVVNSLIDGRKSSKKDDETKGDEKS